MEVNEGTVRIGPGGAFRAGTSRWNSVPTETGPSPRPFGSTPATYGALH